MDNIIFGSDVDTMNQRFAIKMQKEFKVSMLGEFFFFLVLNIVGLGKHLKETFKKFRMENFTPISSLVVTE